MGLAGFLNEKEILDKIPAAIYICDEDGYIIHFNSTAKNLWGYIPARIEDMWKGDTKILHADGSSMQPADYPIYKVLKHNVPVNEEIIIQYKTGNRSVFLAQANRLFDNEGNPAGAITTLTDVTIQKQQEQVNALAASIIDSTEDAIVTKTPEGIITSVNDAALALFGYTRDEMVGNSVTMLIPNDRLGEEDVILSKIRNKERVEHFETVRVQKGGTPIPVSLTISPIKDAKGNVIGASKIARNISKQKGIEEKLQRYTERLEILYAVDQLIAENLEVDDILQKVTDATTKLTGADFGAFFYNKVDENGESYMLYTLSGVSKDMFKGFPMPRNTAVFAPTFNGDGVVRSGNIRKDPRYGHNTPHNGMPKGHLPVVSYLAVPVKSKTGTVLGGLFFGHKQEGMFTGEHEDIVTAISIHAAYALDNANLYEKSSRLNAKKDEFIGLASHELKTPLTSMLGYLQIIRERLSEDNMNKVLIEKSLEQGNKLSALVNDLLDVVKIESGKLPLSFEDFNLVALLRDVVDLMQHSTKTHQLNFYTKEENIVIRADKQRIEQVIVNLLSNAIKYSFSATKVDVSLTLQNKEVIVVVKDYGIGIKKQQQQNLFSRFFRVEDDSKTISGLGIGLYICKEIIQRHDGKIWVESEYDQGSTFYFSLPLNT